jgi:hypothetical protein
MTKQEAKQILQSYRPGSNDDKDPFFAAALELARTDSELGKWFALQCEFDQLMASSLESITPPAGLRDAILARNATKELPKQNSPFVSKNFLLALAAAIALMAGIAVFHTPSSNAGGQGALTAANFAREALDIKEQGRIRLERMSQDPQTLRNWLAQRGAPSNFVLPPGLKGVPSFGCESFDLGGTKVSLICFELGNNQVAHLFVVDKSALKDASQESQPEFREDHGIAFATWTSGDKSYVLTGDNVSMETIRKLI